MNEIIFKDKVITKTQDTLEIRRIESKWVQSFFEVALIKMVISLFIITSIFVFIFYFNEGSITSKLFIIFIAVGISPLTRTFLQYFKARTIPLDQIKDTDISRNNQFVITYTDNKIDKKHIVNLPNNSIEREAVINELIKEGLLEDDIPELSLDREERMHKNNLYLGISATLICFAGYFALQYISISNFVLAFISIILLFSVISIIFSANKLMKMKNSNSHIRRYS